MAVFNLGSINIDHFYGVDHLPKPGETLTANSYSRDVGGKGANQSIAVAWAGGLVHHIGAVGIDGDWVLEKLEALGISTSLIARLDCPTGHAIINVEPGGENAIVVHGSANTALGPSQVLAGLNGSRPGDFLLLQNETNLVQYAAEQARLRGLQVVYSAAPFASKAVAGMLPLIDILALNQGEAAQLTSAGIGGNELSEIGVLVTKGSKGAEFRRGGVSISVAAHKVSAVDSTGAGDTFLGFFAAGLDGGMSVENAMRQAAAAAAIQVTRHGTATAIPTLAEVTAFLTK